MALRSNTRRFRLGALGLALSFTSGSLHAQDAATAAAAFDKALEHMQSEDYAAACPLFAESHRLDPKPAVLFTQAECEARWGKLATAIAHYDDFLAILARLPSDQRARHRDREQVAIEQRAALSRRVPRLTLVLPASAPKATRVERDGVEIGAPLLGVELPIDPGRHVIVTRAPGGPEKRHVIEIEPETRQRIELTVLPPRELPEARGAPERQPAEPAAPLDPAAGSTTQQDLGYVGLGIGLTGLVVGATFGALAMDRKRVVDERCDGPVCDRDGKQAADRGKTFALVSTIAFGVGIGGSAAGIVLLATAPAPERARNGSLDGLRFGIGGRF